MTRFPATVAAIAAGVAAAAGVMVGLGWLVADRATAPAAPRRYTLRLHGVRQIGERAALGIDRSRGHDAPGRYSVFFPGGHAVVGAVLEEDRRVVWRELERVDGNSIAAARWGSWSGYIYIAPEELDLPWSEVIVTTEHGPAPAWRFDPVSRGVSGTWAIHVHGLGSTRAGMLRGVPVLARAGMTSLVISYRNDGAGPAVGNRRSTLGATEARDLNAAIAYALANGATRVLLVGWSMGAQMALLAAIDGPHAHAVSGVIAVSPVLDWGPVLRANCRQANLPPMCGTIAEWLLSHAMSARLIGLPSPVPTRAMNWVRRANQITLPLLILRGVPDRSVPAHQSRELARRQPTAALVTFDADHTMEWNADPRRWDESITNWLRTHVESDRDAQFL